MPHKPGCVHYQLNDGRAVEVEKDQPYEYCTADPIDDLLES
jgi:hypothetical protein